MTAAGNRRRSPGIRPDCPQTGGNPGWDGCGVLPGRHSEADVPVSRPETRRGAVTYYPTGELWEEQHFKEGKLEGLCAMYRKDGTLWRESSYAEGRLHGPSRSYHENGQIESVSHYERGRLHGAYEYNDRFGCLREKGSFGNGVKDGIYTTYDESGEVTSMEIYQNGRMVHTRKLDTSGMPVRDC